MKTEVDLNVRCNIEVIFRKTENISEEYREDDETKVDNLLIPSKCKRLTTETKEAILDEIS